MISVCMTTYNGEKFIKDQIASIISQLRDYDEIIVCDDGSLDKTVEIIESISDNRIKLYRNKINLGHVKNFEKTISLAKGKYIFLSDQDDIWNPNKIEITLNIFEKDNNISLVYHNFGLIDEYGNATMDQFPQYNEGKKNKLFFFMRQLIKPQIYGCACAINRSKINTLIPFPSCVYAHDHWIALWAIMNGDVYFIKNSLLNYRKHNSNLSPKKPLPLKKIVRNRLLLSYQSIICLLRKLEIL